MMLRPVPGIPIEQQPDPVLRRLVAWAEARGEGPLGQLAILWVIRNRAHAHGKTEGAVILAPLQFSSFNHDDPNRAKLLTAFVDDPVGWSMSDAVCALLEANVTNDPTLGALNYYNPAVANPAWGEGSKDWVTTATIKNHIFGRADA